MSDESPRTFLAVVAATALVFAAITGGAVTYATFTDVGTVAVTVSVGDVSQAPDAEPTGNGTPPTEADSNGTDPEGAPRVASETERKARGVPDDGDPRSDNETDDTSTNDTGANDTTTEETATNDTATEEMSTNDTATNDTSTGEHSVNNDPTVDRTSVRVRSERKWRRNGDAVTSFLVSMTVRDAVSGDAQR